MVRRKPAGHGLGERFNGKFRDERMSLEWFRNRTDAKIASESRRRPYNDVRPHSSRGSRMPAEFKRQYSAIRLEQTVSQVRIGPKKIGRSLVAIVKRHLTIANSLYGSPAIIEQTSLNTLLSRAHVAHNDSDFANQLKLFN